MSTNDSRSGWNQVAQWLHWLVAALIVTQFVLGQLAEAAAAADQPVRQLALLANHKSVGITVLALAIVRLGWRWGSTVPDLPATMPRWQVRASRLTHWFLYLLIFALPVSGWLMSSASAYTVSWFNLVELPDLVGADETLKDQLVGLHHLLATSLFVLAAGHILAALKHHFLDRDTVLAGMFSPTTVALFVIVATAAIWGTTLTDAGGAQSPEASAAISTSQPIETTSEVEPWSIDYSTSSISFKAEQAGAAFTGTWPNWQADVRFDPAATNVSSAVVEIDVTNVATGDAERDETMLAASWFAANAYPTATFATDSFTRNSDGTYTASAVLTIKNLTTPVEFTFSIAGSETGGRILDGAARLDRLALQLGTGEWADPTWVGQFVDVAVHLQAQP